jgi:hypothetical protein
MDISERERNQLHNGAFATPVCRGFHSIDVTEDWGALYREEKERIMFADLGTHD